MNKIIVFIGAIAGGGIGWWIGEQIGFMTAFMLSILGTAVGIYYARKIAKEHLS